MHETSEQTRPSFTLESTHHRSGLLAQGKEGGKLLLRYTLQQQFHQDVKSLHTDAWLEHTSSAGQRALQVGDDSKWVVIASSGLQRAAANVGAGGMLKKNLPVSISATSAILPALFLYSNRKTDTSMSLHVWLSGQCFESTYEANELRLCCILHF